MEFVQDALTYAIEALALSTLLLPVHYAWRQVKAEVDSWGVPHATPVPHVEAEPETKPEAQAVITELPETEAVVTKLPEVAKSRKSRSKKARQPKLQPMSVGAAAVDHAAMNTEQLRKACTLQGIEWRNGGDYGKPMKKAQMLAALR